LLWTPEKLFYHLIESVVFDFSLTPDKVNLVCTVSHVHIVTLHVG